MIDFYDGELKDILPASLITPETVALSFAVGNALRRLQDFSKGTHLYADLGHVSEEVLDLLALEFNTQYYDRQLKREIKEGLVAQTLTWYMRAGTPPVLREFLATVLQGGELQEWYEYGGEPYYFKAVAVMGEEDQVPVGYGAEIRRRIGIYKNIRSWLESLAFALNTDFRVHVQYHSRLLIRGEFYARNNRSFLYLDGTWYLDNAYLLNGYQEAEALDFYPARLSMYSQCAGKVRAEGQGRGRTGVLCGVGTSGRLELGGAARAEKRIFCRERFFGEIHVQTESRSGLRVEKNLWYLDNSYFLDGTRFLDAEVFEYEL